VEPLLKGGLSIVDLLERTSLDQVLFYIKNIIYFLYKTSYLIEEVNCTLGLPLQLVFPGF